MANNDEHELRIVDVRGSLQLKAPCKPVLPPKRPAPTREEALEHVRSMRGAASVIERIPALGDINTWGEVAFWGVNHSTGAALHFGPLFWNLDCFGDSLAFFHLNDIVGFWGAEPIGLPPGPSVTPPLYPDPIGQIWCELNVAASGYYVFVAYMIPNLEPPDYRAYVQFYIDDISLRQEPLIAAYPLHSFVVRLDPGVHRFTIKQLSGIFYFQTLTAWHILVPTLRSG